MKQVILFLFLTVTSLSFAQEIENCSKEGIFFIQRKYEVVDFVLVKNNEIRPNRGQNENRAYSIFNRLFNEYEIAEYPNIIQNSNVETKLINSKAKITLCYESFKEQYLPFALGEVNELTLISQKGIPFLTFTRIE